jgi:hypothetical protein
MCPSIKERKINMADSGVKKKGAKFVLNIDVLSAL